MKIPQGFLFAGIQAGIKPNRKDLALVYSKTPCTAAGTFTLNKARAAPVLDAEERLPGDGFHAVVVNSGNANALTGPAGLEDVRTVCAAVARELQLGPDSVVSASTGVIGHRLPAHKIVAAVPDLIKALRPDAVLAAEAIMTTDTRIKVAVQTVQIEGNEVTLSIICKGSGMIAPSLATMIAVVTTDCAISSPALQGSLRAAMGRSFNALTVDNDMSTNDCVFALANGLAGNAPITDPGPSLALFQGALDQLCKQMAKEIAADGEGATKLLEVSVSGAPSEEIALDLARSVAGSSLVKTAIFGADPNWGRVLASIGARAGTMKYDAVEPAAARVAVQDLAVYDRAPLAYDAQILKARMREPEVRVQVDLRAGSQGAVAWGCDLSYDYVKINADYTSLIVRRPDGGVGKDDRLSNYSPTFKVQLLVEALSYIRKFSGTRCVIKYGGAAMVKESLKRSFCDDIGLLRSVGLRPIVVHGGGPEITRTLEKLGGKSEFVDGIRVTNASDLKVVEMVLTGAINTDLVTLLNQEFGHAVGVSGKDGGLLRARKLITEGRDLGQVGEVTRVNKEFLEMLLGQGYVPVISPIGLGEDGQSYNINADAVAAEVASAIGAQKLIYLSDVPGILKSGELVDTLTAADLQASLDDGTIQGGMKAKALSILKALKGGVSRVHLIDGRVPHSIIGELFTDSGIGSLITAGS